MLPNKQMRPGAETFTGIGARPLLVGKAKRPGATPPGLGDGVVFMIQTPQVNPAQPAGAPAQK